MTYSTRPSIPPVEKVKMFFFTNSLQLLQEMSLQSIQQLLGGNRLFLYEYRNVVHFDGVWIDMRRLSGDGAEIDQSLALWRNTHFSVISNTSSR